MDKMFQINQISLYICCLILLNSCVHLCAGSCRYQATGVNPKSCSIEWSFLRSFDCANGNVYEICCFIHPSEIDTNRRKWLRTIVSIGEKLSRSCTKRILCEQSCLNHNEDDAQLIKLTREIVNNSSETNNEYVQAYDHKDNFVCFNLVQSQKSNKATFSLETCKSECTKKYSNCNSELDANFALQCYYASSQLFHKLGVWFFCASHITFEEFRDGAKNQKSNVNNTIESAFTDLYQRMTKLNKAYKQWSTQEMNKLQLQIAKRSNPNRNQIWQNLAGKEMWPQFLVSFNRTDPVLVEHLYESLDHKQFVDSIAVINHTLVSDFGPKMCVGPPMIFTSSSQFLVIVIVFVICLIIILVLMLAPTPTKLQLNYN